MRSPIPSITLSRRAKIAIGVVAVVVVLLILASSLDGVYVDWLWFGEVGYRSVYRTILQTRAVLLVTFGIGMALIIGTNLVVAYLIRPPFRPMSSEQQNLERYRVLVEPRKRIALIVIMVLSGLAAGLAAQSNWKTWLLWINGGSFGVPDPQFGRDVSFYAWDYPVYRLLLGFGFSAIIFSLLLSIGLHYLFGAIRLQTPGPKITLAARRHITVLIFVFIALKAVAYWLDRYGLVFSNRGKVTGASYTDVNASLPAKTILFWIAVIIAAGVLASIWLTSARLPAIGFAVLLILSILISGIYPTLVQQFSVKPNASSKEAKYISRNIVATRQAYDVVSAANGGAVDYKPYAVTASPDVAQITDTGNSPTVGNLRILDPNVVSPTFAQFEKLKNQYGFQAKLDIDRYTVNGTTKDYVLGVRELAAANLQGDQTNWINQHTVYTHGYGFVAAAANQPDIIHPESYTEGSIPVTGPLPLSTPQVYYGELMNDYAIVGAKGTPQEYDGNNGPKVTYSGQGGVKLSNVLSRLAFAVKYQETNFLLNDAVSANGAKIIFVRDPRERVLKVAPFLHVDGDPYPAVIDGRIKWIVDGYTTMSNYPYSEQNSLSDLTSDSLSTTDRTASQPNDQINYIRNSVKATVDAYDGTVTLYQWDTSDPVLKAWMKTFPGLIKPKASSPIPNDVLAHVRYPEDLFEVQRSILQRYHVDDPVTFYNDADKWTVPSDPYAATTANQPPYYVLAGSPDDPSKAQFQLTSPMRVNNSPNLAAYITVDSDPGSDYGRMTVLRPTATSAVQGPEQIANLFKSNTVISKDITLLDSGGSNVVHGNLLTVPIGNTFLYVEPLYVSSGYPVLQRVLVAYGDRIGYAATLSEALANLSPDQVVGQSLTNGSTPTTSTTPTGTSTPPPGPTSSTPAPPTGTATPSTPTSIDAILTQLDAASQALNNAYKTGDPVQIGQAEATIKQLIAAYQAARSATPTPKSS